MIHNRVHLDAPEGHESGRNADVKLSTRGPSAAGNYRDIDIA